jgi:Beta-lactamase class C and other penicillin binding proteins
MKKTTTFYYSIKYVFIMLSAIIITNTMNSCKNNRSQTQTAIEAIDSLFKARYAINGDTSIIRDYPGGAVLIMKGDSIIFDKGYGKANYKTNEAIDGNTFFNIASVSKQFTATAILKLQEEGKLNIQDSIKKYFPEFKADFFNKIKIKHLMSHSSGIPDERPRNDRNFVLTATDMQSMEYIKDLDHLDFEPGTEYEYMNPTFQLQYAIIEKLSGENFVDYMRKNIFDKAGMEKTLYFDASYEENIPHMAHGYILDEDSNNNSADSDLTPDAITAKEEAKKIAKENSSNNNNITKEGPLFIEYDYGEETFFATKADGGIYTSTHEFAQWEKALRNNLIISEKSKQEAHSPITTVSGSKYSSYQNRPYTSYGYGWFIDQTPGMPTKIYHTGDNGGFQIYAGRFPEKQLLILVFENRNDKDRWSMVTDIDNILKKANWLDVTK